MINFFISECVLGTFMTMPLWLVIGLPLFIIASVKKWKNLKKSLIYSFLLVFVMSSIYAFFETWPGQSLNSMDVGSRESFYLGQAFFGPVLVFLQGVALFICVLIFYAWLKKRKHEQPIDGNVGKVVLGYRLYKSEKKEFYESDLNQVRGLQVFLDEVLSGESDLTDVGKKYLLEEGDVNARFEMLERTGGVQEIHTKKELQKWLKGVKPYEIGKFISDAREGKLTS